MLTDYEHLLYAYDAEEQRDHVRSIDECGGQLACPTILLA